MKTSDAVAPQPAVIQSLSGEAEGSASEPSLTVSSAPAARPTPRLRLWPLASTVIFALITICIATDLVADIANGESAWHLAGMAVGTLLSLTGLVLMLRMLSAARARARVLEVALDHTRADSIRWREQAGQVLRGVGALIDRQFGDWGLSPSEREIALLLLKGLSLRSIAEARNASEPTVRQQAQSIYRKGKLSGRAELSAFFLEDLLLPNPSETPPPIAPPRSGAPVATISKRTAVR